MKNREEVIRDLIRKIEDKDLQYDILDDVGYGETQKEFQKQYWDNMKNIILGTSNGMRIIFLDIDGVLNNENMYRTKKHASNSLDPKNIEVLNELIEDTKAKVVISSSWRCGSTIDSILSKMKTAGYKHDILDFTPILGYDHNRGNEIHQWLKEYEKEVQSYVIFDDDSDMLLWQRDYFIWVDRYYGLTPTMAWKAKHILLNRSINDNYYWGV